MVKQIQHIALILTLLLLGGTGNEAWGKVTYHILTLPFTTKKSDGTDRGTYIVEALRCTSDELTVGLPEYFKSPLASNFKYYAANNVMRNGVLESEGGSDARSQIYVHIITTYDTYSIVDPSVELKEGAVIADDSHVYVTYSYNNTTSPINLNGEEGRTIGGIVYNEDYNIALGDRFLCFNKARNNRVGAILATNVTNENLISNDFTYVTTNGFDSSHDFHFRFWYIGNDPYNITIQTSYVGDGTFIESDKWLNKNVKKWYKGSTLFCKGENDGHQNLWMASDDHIQYTQTDASGEVTYESVPGYYRGGKNGESEMNPIWNSFAILQPDPTQGYIYIGSKINSNGNNWQPDSKNQYFYLTGNVEKGKNPRFQLKTPANVEKSTPYPIDTYTYKVTSSLGTVISVSVNMSDYNKSASLLSYIPDDIKRKYVTFTGAYKTSALDDIDDNEMTTFAEAEANGNVIWLKYTSSMPFEALSSISSSYDNARWYTIRMNGDQENKYVAYYDTANGNVMNTGSGRGSESDIHQGENSPEAKVAFIGDPFELKIISHMASETVTGSGTPTASDNRYVGCPSNSDDGTALSGNMTGSSGISSWEIVYENTQMETMILRQMGTVDAPKYIGWNYSASNKPMTYSTTGSRMKVVALDKKNYVYHIMRADGTIAVKATEAQDVGRRLKYSTIPEVIRSPLIDPSVYTATITFYWSAADAVAGTNPHDHAPYDPATEGYDIYVRYTTSNSLSDNYNVRLNGQYIYHDNGNINSQASVESNVNFEWYLDLTDPYSMKIRNQGALTSDEPPVAKYVKFNGELSNGTTLTWDADVANASLFIVKSSTIENLYEVMAATGDGVDAAETYYNIGRPAANTVRMYSNTTYAHGYAQIRFLLTPTDAMATDYHLIDKSGEELVVVRSMRQDFTFPADYHSPLVENYYYWKTDACNATLSTLGDADKVGGVRQVWVTYDTSNRIDLQRGVMYLLKYEPGTPFRQEDGADGLTDDPVPPVYPYCNGDCNFFVYGQDEYELQQQGAASTRTRWAWYLESTNNDPYHVKVCSRQSETYSNAEHRGYFCTYAESWGPTGAKTVVTNLVWPGITGDQPTEYMVLGSVGQYQLVTTETVPVDQNNDGDYDDANESNERQVVKSFEQYWKTFDTIRKKVFGESSAKASQTDPTTVPATPLYAVTTAAGKDDNRKYLSEVKEWHNYQQWAYAKRWNGYNISGATSKGWEEIEHWYQTVNMGEGYFDFVPITIEPALILIDQHGWEIMRKPLPTDPDDPTKEAKYEAIRPYNSPMVKAYHFWGGAKKRTGFHQYYQLSGQIKVDGKNYTSTDLTKLPDYRNADGTINSTLFDKKSNLLDQYVTYVVKDEYAQSYDPSTGEGAKFLIQQGDNYASTSDGTSTNAVATPGGMSQTIVAANGSFTDNQLWYLKPNTDIDIEMGYQDADKYPGGYAHDWTNDYTVTDFSTGFDPYNIQISSAAYTDKYFVTDATGAKIDDGEFVGNNSGTTVSLGVKATGVIGVGHDSRTMPITNATFMAVQDEDGNMQLMPRFDHTLRISNFSSLVVDQIGDAVKLPQTHTQLFRPAVYNYHIIDNSGNESLRYQSGGDLVPQMPEHFKSPLAKEFTFYSEAACTNEITESLAGAGKTDATNDVYVRYLYDEDADVDHILKGKWFTMQLNGKDTKYDDGIKEGDSKPATVDGAEREWQWKFLETPQTEPDPYAVSLYNRSQAEGTKALDSRFALLSHTSGDYALAAAGSETYTYSFLNGTSMNTTTAASTDNEAGFTSTSCSFPTTGSQVKFIDDVVHTYNYKIYTNGTNGANAVGYGVLAISGTQIQAEASQNEFVPILPHAIMTPLLNSDQFLYYEKETDMGNMAKELNYLYGLYEDDVYVRYKAYDPITSGYKVPNQKTIVGGHVARNSKSNDTSLGLSGNLIYNIIWYNDNIMKSNGTAIADGGSKDIPQTGTDYEWQLYGDDPYAIKIKSVKEDKYVYNSSSNSCTLSVDNATTFMLLSKNEYDYGILQVTGDANSRKWTGYGNALTADAAANPTKYVIFALATYKVIYHLVLANIGSQTEEIPYRAGDLPATPVAWTDADKRTFDGTTLRDLTSDSGATYQLGSTMTLGGTSKNYCYDAGAISLGAQLKVPDVFYRPNLDYFYYIEGVYENDACTSPVTDMNNKYKGYALKNMGDDTGLLGKRILINIVYTFQGGLPTNAGDGFVTNASQNKWYTVETTTGDGTPWLAQYTNAWGLEMKEGRGTHYTNDYLWAPVGDPYGFQFYNRYIYKNSGDSNAGETDKVMTSTNNQVLAKGSNTDANSVYELLATSNDGYFMVHPVVNKTGTQYYFKTVNEPDGSVSVKLGTVPSEFRFGLSKELFDPYFRYVGYIGALKQSVCDDDANKALVEAMASSRELTAAELMEAQMLVYNDANLEPFVPGYYRLHSPAGIEGISPVRYASGYTHAIERDPDGNSDEADAIPMHFYEQQGEETTFELLPKQAGGVIGYTESVATRGDIPIPAVEYDPASIFYITGTVDNAIMSTQGLYVKGATAPDVAEGDGVRAKAYMTATPGSASHLWIMDIGGGVMLIHDKTVPANRKYLSYHQDDGAKIYDLKLTHNTHTDHAKWCLQPANKLGLYIKTHSGGDEELYGTSYNYASFYAPFDILLPDTVYDAKDNTKVTKLYEAFICESKNSPWSPPADLHPKGISLYNIAANDCPSKKEEIEPGVERELFRSNNRFVPAGTPVLFAMLDDAGYVKVTLPNSSPSPALVTGFQADGDATLRDNIFSGVYLEQLLSIAASERVFTFGLPLTGSLTLDPTSGEILATLPSQDNTGLGFYLNANKNKELNGSQGGWDRNNRYVLGNRVYHLASDFPTTLSREYTRGVEYVPVMFNDAEGVVEEGLYDNGREFVGDNCIYDLQGRRVATEQEVQNGTWHDRLAPGIYILNGRKFSKK